MRAQGGLYSVLELGVAPCPPLVVGVHPELLVAADEPEAVVERVADPDTRIVTLTITEGGYGRDDAMIELLARGLAARGSAPLAVLSCDNVPDNGAAARAAVGDVGPGVSFPSTVADRITPASDDPLVVVTEPFSQWVIEDFAGPRPEWERAGALIVPDARPYEAMKLRLVNGAHSALAALGLPRGHVTVADAVADPSLLAFVRRLLAEELLPTVPSVPGIDLDEFVEQMLERFANPRMGHRLGQIAAGAEHKIPQRLLPSARELRASGREPVLIESVVAAAGVSVSE
jgi:fructuronate reductase